MTSKNTVTVEYPDGSTREFADTPTIRELAEAHGLTIKETKGSRKRSSAAKSSSPEPDGGSASGEDPAADKSSDKPASDG